MGFLLGIVASVIVSYFWELRERARLYNESGKLVGTWTAYNVKGRMIEEIPVPGAGLTVVTRKSGRFSARAGVLDVQCQDIDVVTKAIREHSGQIVLDRFVPWTAMRIDRYEDSNEISNRGSFSATDPDVVYIFPSPTVASMIYSPHAWRRGNQITG